MGRQYRWAGGLAGGRVTAPEAGNRLIILPVSRREPNALMVEMMKPAPEREGEREEGRVCATSAKLIYHVAKKQEHAVLPSF